jgi:hypothetical protein
MFRNDVHNENSVNHYVLSDRIQLNKKDLIIEKPNKYQIK